MAKMKRLPLGQFAPNADIGSLIVGAFWLLDRTELTRPDRKRAGVLRRQYDSLNKQYKSDQLNLQISRENIWLELEEILESLLPEYTRIDGNRVVPDWGRLDESRNKAPGSDMQPWVGSVRSQNRNAPMFVLEQHLPGDDVVLYERKNAGRGHLWREIWRVTADQVPAKVE